MKTTLTFQVKDLRKIAHESCLIIKHCMTFIVARDQMRLNRCTKQGVVLYVSIDLEIESRGLKTEQD